MNIMKFVRSILVFLALGTTCASSQELPDENLLFVPPTETTLVGRRLPNIDLLSADGNALTLDELSADRPIFLTLVFSRCAGICSPYLGLLRKAVSAAGGSGQQYQMVVVSFDMRDAQADLRALIEHHSLQNDRGWTFASPKLEADRDLLCNSLDFDYRWDEERQQYNHPAMTVAVRAGKIVRLSVGEEITPARFREMIAEASGQYVPIYPEPGATAALFRCFDYDPQRGFTPNWGMMILVAPAAVTLILVVVLFRLANTRQRFQSSQPSTLVRVSHKRVSCSTYTSKLDNLL